MRWERRRRVEPGEEVVEGEADVVGPVAEQGEETTAEEEVRKEPDAERAAKMRRSYWRSG